MLSKTENSSGLSQVDSSSTDIQKENDVLLRDSLGNLRTPTEEKTVIESKNADSGMVSKKRRETKRKDRNDF